MKVALVLVAALAFASAGKNITNRSGVQSIVGGSEAVPHSYPWMTVLISSQGFFCGGSLIQGDNGKYYILTAAHCVWRRSRPQVRLGDHNIFVSEGTEQEIRSQRIHIHPDYDSFTFANDVALVRISRKWTFTDEVEVGKLPTSGLIGDEDLTAIGWGLLEEDGDLSPTLQEVEVMAQSEATCESIYPFRFDPDSMFCAGTLSGGHGICQGDSGSAALLDRGSGLEIVGIASWGFGCAQSGFPGVFVDVYKALDWINPIIN